MRRSGFDYDLIAIGSGSGGSVGATHAAAKGKRVAIVEAERRLGGECPNWACVPTKALLVSADHYRNALTAERFGIRLGSVGYDYKKVRAWKDLVVERTGTAEAEAIFHDQKVDVIHGRAHFIDPHTIAVGEKRYRARKFLIGTGTHNFIPPIEGLAEVGYMTFRQAVDLPAPPKSLCIVGGGAIGCEFAELFSTFGSKVHLVEAAPRLLGREEPEAADLVKAIFEKKGVTVVTGANIHSVSKKASKKVVYYSDGVSSYSIEVDDILVASGMRPNVDIGLENAGVGYDKHGIKANKYLQTTAKHIYAAGDIVGPYQFTHTAAYQSALAANNMFGRPGSMVAADYSCIPRTVFTSPEVASVGITEAEMREAGIRPRIGMAPVSILGRANVTNKSSGLVKVICNRKGVIVGGAIVASRAGEMIHELAVAVHLRATAQQIAGMVHAFPTWSEAVKIACMHVR
jgi:pyruvate/2-oxoglutarate dehydrogenase complex dihydrolipoamide dehydrogenase (E3) component